MSLFDDKISPFSLVLGEIPRMDGTDATEEIHFAERLISSPPFLSLIARINHRLPIRSLVLEGGCVAVVRKLRNPERGSFLSTAEQMNPIFHGQPALEERAYIPPSQVTRFETARTSQTK